MGEDTGSSVVEPRAAPCRRAVEEASEDGGIIAQSPAMREILKRAGSVAGTDVPVLIQGEMGAGKRTIAEAIHRRSSHAAGPLVRVACGSLREASLDETLFGPPRDGNGQGTAAAAGLVESSRCGTLVLAEVTQIPFWAQVKLLDVLQSGGGQRGRDGTARPHVRVIASSTCHVQTAVLENRVYAGLYYYLNAVQIDIPPLRHRPEDVRALAEHFLAADFALGSARHTFPRHFSEEAYQYMLRYDWPGNVLQLAAVVAHAAMLAEGLEIGRAAVAGLLDGVRRHAVSPETISVPLSGSLKEVELALIKETIRRHRGNKAAAARALGLHRRTLYRLLEKSP